LVSDVRFVGRPGTIAVRAGSVIYGMDNYNRRTADTIAASITSVVNQAGMFVVKGIRRVTNVITN
jgi:hypothetical protein